MIITAESFKKLYIEIQSLMMNDKVELHKG
jgi:hypothetical protein